MIDPSESPCFIPVLVVKGVVIPPGSFNTDDPEEYMYMFHNVMIQFSFYAEEQEL